MKRYYTVDTLLMEKSDLSLIEWCILENIKFRENDSGWCHDSKKNLARHHAVTERGFFKIRKSLIERSWLKTNSKGYLKTTKKWFELQTKKHYEQSSDYEQSSYEQSSDSTMNKVPTSTYKREYKRERATHANKKSGFNKPTLDEIKEYASFKKLSIDTEKFYDYFEAGNWIDSKGNKVKNWKQKLLTWNNYTTNKSNENQNTVNSSIAFGFQVAKH